MNSHNSPLEHLTSTVFNFALGITTISPLALYSRWLQRRAKRDADDDVRFR
jgi:hypothetical protein